MSINAKPRTKDHWSIRLRLKRPDAGSRTVVLVLALVQAFLLYLTASSFAESGALYGCSIPCGPAGAVATPFFAVVIGVAVFVLPAVIGVLCATWMEAVTLAMLPWWLAVIFTASTQLTPTAGMIRATHAQPATSHFGAPFWLDAGHLIPLLLGLLLFAALGWLGWLARQALTDA